MAEPLCSDLELRAMGLRADTATLAAAWARAPEARLGRPNRPSLYEDLATAFAAVIDLHRLAAAQEEKAGRLGKADVHVTMARAMTERYEACIGFLAAQGPVDFGRWEPRVAAAPGRPEGLPTADEAVDPVTAFYRDRDRNLHRGGGGA